MEENKKSAKYIFIEIAYTGSSKVDEPGLRHQQ